MSVRRVDVARPIGEHVVLWCGCELRVTCTGRSRRARRVIIATGDHCAMPAHTRGGSLVLSQMLAASEQLLPSRR